jgi:hypothetical protein
MRTKCRSRGRGIGVSRESFRPGKLLPEQLATGDLLTNRKICEKVRLRISPKISFAVRRSPFAANLTKN